MMNKIMSIPWHKCEIYTAYTNEKIAPQKTQRTVPVKQEQLRASEPLEDLMDYMHTNPFRVLLACIFGK